LEEIYDFMDELEATYPEISEVEMMGRTEGGVEIRGLRITNEEHLGQETLPVIFVTAGASARDWIAIMAAVNLMHELCDHYEDFRNIVDNVEWFIIPVANPDGYIFSQTTGVSSSPR
jgi:murein tripeptide amidase MpaA